MGRRVPEVTLSPAMVFLTAFFLYLGYGNVWLTTLLAAAFHECGHLAALGLAGVPVTALRIRMGGAVIVTPPMGYRQELLSAAAGPAASLLLAAVCWDAAELAARISAGLLIFNLLPVYPMDGGRILRSALALRLEPSAVERIVRTVGLAVGAAVMGFALWLAATGPEIWPMAAASALLLRTAVGEEKWPAGKLFFAAGCDTMGPEQR